MTNDSGDSSPADENTGDVSGLESEGQRPQHSAQLDQQHQEQPERTVATTTQVPSSSPPHSPKPAAAAAVHYEDTSTDCAICLDPLYNNSTIDDSDENETHVITLTCGHKWHFQCVVRQLQTAQPKADGRRLLFRGCQCAKCGTVCDDHPRLEKVMGRSTDRLRTRVDELLQEQLQEEAPDVWRHAHAQGPAAVEAVLQEGRQKYAFYLCAHCEKPYFGGTVDCAEEMVREDEQQSSAAADERLCPACAPQAQVICQNPLEHGRYLVWKCRYCCQPASHLCYGNVHFCDACHERNSARVRHANKTSRSRNGPRPPPLNPVHCPGCDACGFPMPQPSGISRNSTHHKNGNTVDCEQVYYCSLCDSSGRGGRHSLHNDIVLRPGSENLVRNPSGSQGLVGWQQVGRGGAAAQWEVEQSELPLNAETTTNFVSSFQPCIMGQIIDLDAVLQVDVPKLIHIECSARYTGRTDCPSVFALHALVLPDDDNNTSVQQQRPQSLHRRATPTLQAPPGDYWERASLDLEVEYWSPSSSQQTNSDSINLPRPRFLKIVVIGKDGRFWQGRFGSKVAGISVRILGTPQELETVMSPAATRRIPIDEGGAAASTASARQQQAPQHREVRPQSNADAAATLALPNIHMDRAIGGTGVRRPYTAGRLFWEVLLPVVCFLILTWLTQT